MKKILFTLFFIGLSSLIYGQKVDSLVVETSILTGELSLGEKALFGNSSIKFLKVISDSRCPKGVTCVWAGEARVLVGFFTNGVQTKVIEIEIPAVNSSVLLQKNKLFKVAVLGLSPYPNAKTPISPNEYSLLLTVEKAEERK